MGLADLEALTNKLIDHDERERQYKDALHEVLQLSKQGFWIWNIQTSYLHLTWPWLKELDYNRSDLKPHVSSWVNLCHPEDYLKAERQLKAHFQSRGKIPYDLPIRYKAKNNGWVTLRSFGKVCSWKGDEPIMMVGIVEAV